MYKGLKVSVIIPCYCVADYVVDVIAAIPQEVDHIFCIDDACPEASGRKVEREAKDPRVTVIYNENNLGVGGAVKAGYVAARRSGYDVAIKIDGDGQMDPGLIPALLHPIALGQADYTKGGRSFRLEDVRSMPRLRLFGNAVLSFLAKFSTGYWHIFDPTNGYTALHLSVLQLIQLDKIADRYFFETDLLFRLNIARCAVRDVPMVARYSAEPSGLRPLRVLFPFMLGHLTNFVKRVFYTYFLRDFQIASILLLLGPLLVTSGLVFGVYHWWLSHSFGMLATAGTVMVGALMIITGLQMSLSGLSYDMGNSPRDAVHPLLLRPDQNARNLNVDTA